MAEAYYRQDPFGTKLTASDGLTNLGKNLVKRKRNLNRKIWADITNLREAALFSLTVFLNGPTPASFCFFPSFQTQILQKKL